TWTAGCWAPRRSRPLGYGARPWQERRPSCAPTALSPREPSPAPVRASAPGGTPITWVKAHVPWAWSANPGKAASAERSSPSPASKAATARAGSRLGIPRRSEASVHHLQHSVAVLQHVVVVGHHHPGDVLVVTLCCEQRDDAVTAL